jgi:hypothetical protein
MFHETNDSGRTSFENIMIASQQDIWEDTKPRSLSPETIGGPESKLTLESTLMDAKHANEQRHIEKRLTTHYIRTRSLTHHGNTSRSISLGSYWSPMALTPS